MKQNPVCSLKLLAAWPAKRSTRLSDGPRSLFSQPALQHKNVSRSFQSQSSPFEQCSQCLRQPLVGPKEYTPSFRKTVTASRSIFAQVRPISTTIPRQRPPSPVVKKSEEEKTKPEKRDEDDEDDDAEFGRTEKASQASQINLSARLSKEGSSQGQSAGFGEVWRLIKIARPEIKILGAAFVLLLISSSITMSIPFSIGKILDIATSGASKETSGADGAPKEMLFGLDINTFYLALGGILATGAAANYGRIIILRIVGERVVARLRSNLFRRTFIQNAEFFDANRVGDLISRLSSDTIIVGKSITQNLSDGLRSLVSGAAGFGLMAYVSLKLTGILCLLFPPVAIGAFFYGRAIRNLSRNIQKNLGTLTKIAEERLGNVRTSQAFAGELLEVHRYNKQVRKLFELGKRESFISATFFFFWFCGKHDDPISFIRWWWHGLKRNYIHRRPDFLFNVHRICRIFPLWPFRFLLRTHEGRWRCKSII